MDMPTRGKPDMNLRPHMVAAYAGDGGFKAFGRDIGAGNESAKDYYGTGITPRARVIDALRALDRKLAHRQAQLRRLHADVLERLRHEEAASAARRGAHQGGARALCGAALDHQANHSGS